MPLRLAEEDPAALTNPPAGTVDLLVDEATHEFATKKPDGSVDSLIGPTGPAGADGADGADGAPGADGADGAPGADGADGAGVPTGGTTGQLLAKASSTDLDTDWVDSPSGGGGSGRFDWAAGRPYTIGKAAHTSFPEKNIAKNGSSQTGVLTMAGYEESAPAGSTGFTAPRALGWRRASELAGSPTDAVDIRVDLGTAREIAVARLHGWWNTGNQVVHPKDVELFWSDDDSSFTSWASVTGMGANPGSLAPSHWMVELAATAASHRYWRWRVTQNNNSSDDWLMVVRTYLFG